jgi:PAS domain S-box-containing protein
VITPLGPGRELLDEPRRARPGAAAGDPVRRAGGPVRMALAVLLVAASPLVEGATSGDRTAFGLAVALGWIPAVGALSVLGRRRPHLGIDLATLVLDLVLLALVQALLAPPPLFPLASLLVLVATTTYLVGRWLGATAGVVGVGLLVGVAAASSDPNQSIDAFTAVVYPVLLLLVAFLLDVVATDRWHASTGLRHLHDKSDAILTGVGEAVVVTSREGVVQQWNRAATDTFGTAAEDARGRPCDAVLGLLLNVRELDCSQGCALLRQGEADDLGDGVPVDVEVWRKSPTGSRQPLLASASPVLGPHGDIVEVVHSFRDITRLKQADEAKTLFLATASHELKTPLTVIRGFAQMLLLPDADLTPDEQDAALRAIDSRSGQLTNIVDRLLMSSRIEAGRIELAPAAVDVLPILVERAAALEGATGREVHVVVPDSMPAARCDEHAFTTVVDHLLDNAVKYSPNGGPVTLAADATDDGVEVLVADVGVGMTEEQAQHCFDRFWQAEATDVRRFGGTGIGLYIVRSLVDAMGGSIVVTSAPGAGSTFRFVLDRADRPPRPRLVPAPEHDRGEQTMIREYMRQLGVLEIKR